MSTRPKIAFSSDDLDRAYREHGLNCGPSALAACLGWSLDAVLPHLGDFERRGYMNVTMMANAIGTAGFWHYESAGTNSLPTHGLARVAWHGPWPPRAQSCYTHWIATKLMPSGFWIFDVNAGWQLLEAWQVETAPSIIATIKRADGTWEYTHRWEVRKKRSANHNEPG